jgi:hypothetical protein
MNEEEKKQFLKVYDEKFSPRLENLTIVEQCWLFAVRVIDIRYKDLYDPSVKYTKKYFAKYYRVDIDTFNKWLNLYCPELNVKKEIGFNEIEWKQILDKIGTCDLYHFKARNKKDLSNLFALNPEWKKSKKYAELKIAMEDFFSIEEQAFNKFTPIRVNEFLNDNVDGWAKQYREERSQNVITIDLMTRIIEEELYAIEQWTKEERRKFHEKAIEWLMDHD